MPSPPAFDPARTAVLSMDLQDAIVHIYAKGSGLTSRAASVLAHARARGVRVIHVQFGFRPGWPEVNPVNRLLAAIKANPQHQAIFEGAAGAIHADVAPQPGEIVVIKHRVSAFAGTDLDQVLRANGIDTLVLFGIATSGVVLSTLLEASDADYRIAVVKDCCADLDGALHACLIDRFFPTRADVLTSIEITGVDG